MAQGTTFKYGYTTGSKTGNFVNVNVDGTVITAAAERDITYANGDPVIVFTIGSQWFVGSRYYAALSSLPENDTPPNPKPTVTKGALPISPVETRSYRPTVGGWRTDDTDVYQGQYGGYGNHYGCAFYGDKPKSLTGATVTGATLKMECFQQGDYPPKAPTMRLMTNSTRPVGVPTLTSSQTGPVIAMGARNEAVVIPVAWAQSMVDGTAGGICVYDASGYPYIRYSGRDRWSPAFTLTINWTRG